MLHVYVNDGFEAHCTGFGCGKSFVIYAHEIDLCVFLFLLYYILYTQHMQKTAL